MVPNRAILKRARVEERVKMSLSEPRPAMSVDDVRNRQIDVRS
jgi:hypothetical protein